MTKPNTELRERVAFAMFRAGYPAHIAEHLSLDQLVVVETPLGDGVTAESNIALDWEFNKDSYLKLADAAIAEIITASEERPA